MKGKTVDYITIQLEVANTKFNFNYYEQNISKSINLTVSNFKKQILEIGDDYGFVNDEFFNYYNKQNKNNKKYVEGNVTIYNADEQADSVEKFNISNGKIGDALFYKEYAGEYGDDGGDALLSFRLYVKAEMFNYIYENLLNKNKVEYLSIDMTGLEYGWEPDGSRAVWKIDEAKRTQMTDLRNFTIGFNPVKQKEEVNVYEDKQDKVDKREATTSELLKQIKLYTSVSAIATALILLTIYFH